ncbi:MAG TPA: DEAD/DEAH box helicase [Anaerolineaceae bacterium]|nr:DEAD/DEAH box helicase [Anaerolineaceae bacterium]
MTTNFDQFGLRPELIQAVTALGYEEPTPIQEGILPLMLSGQDVMGQAQTGTGKTAAFALPILDKLDPSLRLPQALVIVPTRELALQAHDMIKALGQFSEPRVLAVYGGTSYGPQLNELRNGVQVVVGTPGRLLDLLKRQKLQLEEVKTVVLDEADEMLSMGFIDDVESLLAATPKNRQTTLFSATLPTRVRQLAEKYLHNPQTISITAPQVTVAAIEQRFYLVNEHDKLAVLTRLFETENITSALIFARTRVRTAELVNELSLRGFPSEALSGDISQDARERTMARFRAGQVKVLVATDVAARGLDVEGISHVFNYDLPDDVEVFVHRIGRTGRAGRAGVAISLARPSEKRTIRDIERFTKQLMTEGQIPTAQDIQSKRTDELLAKIDVLLRRQRVKEERALVEGLVASGVDPMDLAAVAIKIARAEEKQRPIDEISPLPVKAERPERRERSDRHEGQRSNNHASPRGQSTGRKAEELGMVRMELRLGKMHGIRPGEVVGTIASIANIPGSSLGRISIQTKSTMVDVPAQHVNQVLAHNAKYQIRKQTFSLSILG